MYHLSINAEKLLEYLGNNDNGHEIIYSKVGRQILKFKKKHLRFLHLSFNNNE